MVFEISYSLVILREITCLQPRVKFGVEIHIFFLFLARFLDENYDKKSKIISIKN